MPRHLATLWALLGLIAGLLPCATATAGELAEARKADLSYFLTQDCGSCHGLKLTGGLGKPLTPAALSLFSDADLVATILDGRPGTAMPPWRGVIDETDARFLVKLLREGDPR